MQRNRCICLSALHIFIESKLSNHYFKVSFYLPANYGYIVLFAKSPQSYTPPTQKIIALNIYCFFAFTSSCKNNSKKRDNFGSIPLWKIPAILLENAHFQLKMKDKLGVISATFE